MAAPAFYVPRMRHAGDMRQEGTMWVHSMILNGLFPTFLNAYFHPETEKGVQLPDSLFSSLSLALPLSLQAGILALGLVPEPEFVERERFL